MVSADIDRKKELENCTFVKTALTIIVVFYHSVLFWNGTWFTSSPVYEIKALSLLAKWLNTFHIYGFTLVSGYLFYFLKHENGKYRSFLPFVKNKAKRLLIPYTAVSIIWAIPFRFFTGKINWNTILYNYVLGISPSQLWFLLMLFNVFIITWRMSSWFKEHDILCLAIAVVLYVIGFIGPKFFPNVFQIWTSFKYIIFFLIGFKIRQHGSKQLMRIPGAVWLFLSISLFVLRNHLPGASFAIKLLSMGISVCSNIIGAVMSFVILQKIAQKVQYQNSRLIALLAKLSMPIYLLHQQLIYIFITLLKGVINPYIHALINFFGALFLSVLLSALLTKFKATSFLLGENRKT